MIMLFINNKLLIIDNYLSKGFPGQLYDALCKYIAIIFAYRVYAKVAQLVEYISSKDRLFYLWESGGGGCESHCVLIFFFSILLSFLFNFISLLFYFHYFLLIIRHFINITVQFDIQTNLFSIYL